MWSVLICASAALLQVLSLCLLAGSVSAAQEWPLHRGTPSLTGAVTTRVGIPAALSWRYQADHGRLTSPVGIGDRIFVAGYKGTVLALTSDTGTQLWQTSIEKQRFAAAPSLFAGLLGIGSESGLFVVLNQSDGAERWRFKTAGKIAGSANVYRRKDGVLSLIFVSSDDQVYSLDADKGTVLWSYKLDTRIEVTPAVVDNNVVFGGCDGFVRVLDADSGLELAQMETSSYIPVSAAVQWPHVFVGNHEAQFLCVDPFKEEVVWVFEEREAPYTASPAVGGGRVIFGGDDNRVHCLSDEGLKFWEFTSGEKVQSAPLLVGDKVFIGSDDGFIYCLAANNGTRLWSYEAGDPVDTDPALVNNYIVVSAGKAVYAFAVSELP